MTDPRDTKLDPRIIESGSDASARQSSPNGNPTSAAENASAGTGSSSESEARPGPHGTSSTGGSGSRYYSDSGRSNRDPRQTFEGMHDKWEEEARARRPREKLRRPLQPSVASGSEESDQQNAKQRSRRNGKQSSATTSPAASPRGWPSEPDPRSSSYPDNRPDSPPPRTRLGKRPPAVMSGANGSGSESATDTSRGRSAERSKARPPPRQQTPWPGGTNGRHRVDSQSPVQQESPGISSVTATEPEASTPSPQTPPSSRSWFNSARDAARSLKESIFRSLGGTMTAQEAAEENGFGTLAQYYTQVLQATVSRPGSAIGGAAAFGTSLYGPRTGYGALDPSYLRNLDSPYSRPVSTVQSPYHAESWGLPSGYPPIWAQQSSTDPGLGSNSYIASTQPHFGAPTRPTSGYDPSLDPDSITGWPRTVQTSDGRQVRVPAGVTITDALTGANTKSNEGDNAGGLYGRRTATGMGSSSSGAPTIQVTREQLYQIDELAARTGLSREQVASGLMRAGHLQSAR
ncbi:hypothetical protein IAU60_001687 [Kwoniella sp. DSM 27419]